MVGSDTPARSASVCWSMPSRARAARNWTAMIMRGNGPAGLWFYSIRVRLSALRTDVQDINAKGLDRCAARFAAAGGDRPAAGAPWLFDRPAADARRVAGGKDVLPVCLHVDDDPAVGRRRIEGGAEAADMGEAVIGVLTLGIGVMHDHAETAPVASKRCPLEHFKITIGIAKRRDRATAD